MTLQPTGLDSRHTHLFIFLNLIEALNFSYLYDSFFRFMFLYYVCFVILL